MSVCREGMCDRLGYSNFVRALGGAHVSGKAGGIDFYGITYSCLVQLNGVSVSDAKTAVPTNSDPVFH